ncbi:MAG: glycerophosphodiester phosphodiesterase [Acidobacteria bacterium]|nr:glycerophosphodiester phosphodiesterase [Acidobacteriota bacterium]
MLVIAHRGASAVEPENTLRAFARSIEMGAQMIELDLHLTRDGHVVVIHDDDLRHTTNARGRVSQLTLEEVRKADAGKGERVPTLQETLELTRGRVQLYLEIKAPQAAARTLRIVREFSCQNEVLLASFDLPLMKELGEQVNDMEIGLILGTPSLNPTVRWREAFPWRALRYYKYQTLCMQVKLCSAILAHKIKEQGKKLYVWTANSEADYARMIQRQVDGIATDTPDRLLAFLQQKQPNQ